MSMQLSEITVPKSNLFVPHELGKLNVMYNGHEFAVIDEQKSRFPIQTGDLSKDLQGISSEHLQKAFRIGFLTVRKIGEDYAIRFNGRIAGGGPILAGLTLISIHVTGVALCLTGVGVVAGAALIAAAPVVAGAAVFTPTP